MMSYITPENPLGTNGFAFVEFSSLDKGLLKQQFLQMGFHEVAHHQNKDIVLLQQGEIQFLLNHQPGEQASEFSQQHGSSAVAMGFFVENPENAQKAAVEKGAKPAPDNRSYKIPAIAGVGGSVIYFIDANKKNNFFEKEFGFTKTNLNLDKGHGLTYIDHLTHNVKQGKMDVWADFYEKIFNFKEIRNFNIQGQMTGLLSRALMSPCKKIRIPINESLDNQSQIEEFIEEFQGEGIQHIALGTDDIYASISGLRQAGIDFLKTPDVYYQMIADRLPWHDENTEKLKDLQILIDGSKDKDSGLLLQIFTENMLGPVFFEIIQRKGDEGFGEGNFQALFEAIEREQIQRGKLS